MESVTLPIEPDEMLGLDALCQLDRGQLDRGQLDRGQLDRGQLDRAAGAQAGPDAAATARALLRAALAGKLNEYGLPWAPSAESVSQRAAEAAAPQRRGLTQNPNLRKGAAFVLALAFLVALSGGYLRGWTWTGFKQNGQLWDWLSLLLLPTVLATIPLLIQDRSYISRIRRETYGVVVVAWCAFVVAGYLVPLGWTGFRGHTLWDWLDLLLLPAALAVTGALAGMHLHLLKVLRSLRATGKSAVAVLAAGWVVTVIGGYLLHWRWTGYTGNTLWDWIQLLLAPIIFPTILLPALLKWITGGAADRAAQAAAAPPPATNPAAAALTGDSDGQDAEPAYRIADGPISEGSRSSCPGSWDTGPPWSRSGLTAAPGRRCRRSGC